MIKSNKLTDEEIIQKLSLVPKARLDLPDFAILRSKIMDKISRVAEPEKEQRFASYFIGSFRTLRITAGLIGTGLILVSLAMGTAIAALQSSPGQTIYPLKRIVENIELKLTRDESKKANLQLKFAENRVMELEKILEQNEEGRLSNEETQKIVAETVKDLQKTATAAASSPKPKAALVNKLKDLNTKLQTASINTEGEVRLELEKAVEVTKISKEEALQNIERAGLQVESDNPINLDEVTATGKLTAVSDTSISIGAVKFYLSSDTSYVNIKADELKIDLVVSVRGQTKDNKTFALEITLVDSPTSAESQ
ncbi:MAG: hypothetical protein HY336_00350 [Candidatus Doudnabacteria bacterium]|nr:hypothetical protein [Candidatus Doudnabacteria bacterium]